MSVFLTSDPHFCHANIINYCSRPFNTVTEMNEKLIENWNSVVKPSDSVYCLGDFSWGKYSENLTIFNRLNGCKSLVVGNHDGSQVTKLPWNFVKETYELHVDGKIYQLFHYPMRTWDKAFHSARHCFGHVHGKLPAWGLSCDVGVDSWNFTPVSIEQLEDFFKGSTSLPKEYL